MNKVEVRSYYYGRPLSVSGRPCYILPMFLFIYLFIFLWPPYSPALVNESSRKFYTLWTLSVIREVTTWIFSWSSLNYRVGQKVTKFGVFSDPTRKLSALTPERGRILQFWKNNLLSTDGCSTVMPRFENFGVQILEIHAPHYCS